MVKVDLAALRHIDAEVDALNEHGEWTQEQFEGLWSRGLAASGGSDRFLDFLRLVAPPSWLPADQQLHIRGGGGFTRLPSRIAHSIHKLMRGWRPREVYTRATSFSWEGTLVPSATAELTGGDSGYVLSGRCNAEDAGVLDAELDGRAGRLVRNEVSLSFPDSWELVIRNAALRRLSQRFDETGVAFVLFDIIARSWTARRTGAQEPDHWISKLHAPLQVGMGNLLIDRDTAVATPNGVALSHSGSWGHMRLRGRYTYYLVSVKDERTKVGHDAVEEETYLIVDTGEGQALDTDILHPDLVALQFVFGMRSVPSTMFGVRGGDIVAARAMGHSKRNQGVGPGPVVPEEMPLQLHATSFFERLSERLATSTDVALFAPISAYIDSRDGTVDQQAAGLLAASKAFAATLLRTRSSPLNLIDNTVWTDWLDAHEVDLFGTLNAAERSLFRSNLEKAVALPPIDIIRRALASAGINLPEPVSASLMRYDARLAESGLLSVDARRSSEELAREIRLNDDLRTILVALVALAVGYTGPIRGPDAPSQSAWWIARALENPSPIRYGAVASPREVSTPSRESGNVLIVVELDRHVAIVRGVLRAAGLPVDRIDIRAADGRPGLKEIAGVTPSTEEAALFLVGSPLRHVPSAVAAARKDLGLADSVPIHCAIQNVEAWLLADDELLRHRANGELLRLRELSELPSPDEIVDPMLAACRFFGPVGSWGEIEQMDAFRASMRSPSLAAFLSAAALALGVSTDLPVQSATRSMSRDVIANVLRQMVPGDNIVWRTSDGGSYTADQIGREIQSGTAAGQQYAMDVLRVAIDFLRREGLRRKT